MTTKRDVPDAVVARDRAGRPVVPGSTLKGLARDEPRRLLELAANRWPAGVLDALFGSRGSTQGKLRFDRAATCCRALDC
ncbi:MAG: RAMP superfamily CRISPR-associated protein [Gammaproteobacteria bacterium]